MENFKVKTNKTEDENINTFLPLREIEDFLDFGHTEMSKILNMEPEEYRKIEYRDIHQCQELFPEIFKDIYKLNFLINIIVFYYNGSITQARLWLDQKNPLLGYNSPREIILKGNHLKLCRLICDKLVSNKP